MSPVESLQTQLQEKEHEITEIKASFQQESELLASCYQQQIHSLQDQINSLKNKNFEDEIERRVQERVNLIEKQLALETNAQLASHKKKYKTRLAKWKQEFLTKDENNPTSDNEKIIKDTILGLKGNYERKIRTLKDQNNIARKRNEELEIILGEIEAKDQVKLISSPDTFTTFRNTESREVLCNKCRAFVQVEEELSNKIDKIKYYLNTH